jgi:hypothetical protein
MTTTQFGTIKIHFTSAKRAIAASVDNTCTAGERSKNGKKVKTWIAKVAKATPYETANDVVARLNETSQIVKETRHGHGGPWVKDAAANCTAQGFLKIVKAESSGQKSVGGYQTRIRIGNKVLVGADWPTTLSEAMRLIDYASCPQDAEYPTWAEIES